MAFAFDGRCFGFVRFIAQTVWPYVEGNRLKPAIDTIFPFAQAAAAHARMKARDHVGKIVLSMDG